MFWLDPGKYGLAAIGIAPAIGEVRSIFPWANSILVAAVSYLPPGSELIHDGARGLVARFAQGVDYHDVLKRKLHAVADALTQTNPHHRFEICVDTTPIPERKLAVMAGVGWQGKNACVFVEDYGSYVALGEIITDLPLPLSSHRETNYCGNCKLCIKACPAQALAEPGIVDRARCISELTQQGGTIPRELRYLLGNRVYGCDVCQEVCPYNANVTPNPEFASNSFPGARPELTPLIRLSSKEYIELVKPSPIGWIGRNRIRRNAMVAAGNLGCADAVPGLVDALSEESATLRAYAAWALGEIGGADVVVALRKKLAGEQDPWAYEEMSRALSNL